MGEKKLPVLSIENMVVVAVKYIQIDNKFNFSNQHKFSHLHFYEMTFITIKTTTWNMNLFCFAFYGTKYAGILL